MSNAAMAAGEPWWGYPYVNGYAYVHPPTSVGSNWSICPLCSVWYLIGTAHSCQPPIITNTPVEAKTTPHKCPCCDGWGERVPAETLTASTAKETCRACSGRGVVWS